METFGQTLRAYREQTSDPKRPHKPLTQERFAELLGGIVGYSISDATISDWEKGKSRIDKDDRKTLVGIVKVLYQCQGVKKVDQADVLLQAGNYRGLNKEELGKISAQWVQYRISDEIYIQNGKTKGVLDDEETDLLKKDLDEPPFSKAKIFSLVIWLIAGTIILSGLCLIFSTTLVANLPKLWPFSTATVAITAVSTEGIDSTPTAVSSIAVASVRETPVTAPATATATESPTISPEPTLTNTATPSPTPLPDTPTSTPKPTKTTTPTPLPPTITPSRTPSPIPPSATATSIPPTFTHIPPTNTPTFTIVPTPLPSSTPTLTHTPIPTVVRFYPSEPACGPNNNIRLAIAPISDHTRLWVYVTKCNQGEKFTSSGQYYLVVDGVRHFGPFNYYEGTSYAREEISPVGNVYIGFHYYQIELYPEGQIDAIWTGIVEVEGREESP